MFLEFHKYTIYNIPRHVFQEHGSLSCQLLLRKLKSDHRIQQRSSTYFILCSSLPLVESPWPATLWPAFRGGLVLFIAFTYLFKMTCIALGGDWNFRNQFDFYQLNPEQAAWEAQKPGRKRHGRLAKDWYFKSVILVWAFMKRLYTLMKVSLENLTCLLLVLVYVLKWYARCVKMSPKEMCFLHFATIYQAIYKTYSKIEMVQYVL